MEDTKRIYVMAVDHGEGLEAYHRWSTDEANARHFYEVNTRPVSEMAHVHTALIDPQGRTLIEANA